MKNKINQIFSIYKDEFLVCFSAVGIIFMPYLTVISSDYNQVELKWNWIDGAILTGVIITSSLLAAVFLHFLLKTKRSQFFNALLLIFVLVLFVPNFRFFSLTSGFFFHGSVIAFIKNYLPLLSGTIKILVPYLYFLEQWAVKPFIVASYIYFALKKTNATAKFLKYFFILLSPLGLVFCIFTFTYAPVLKSKGSLADIKQNETSKMPPIFFIVFDGWTYDAVFSEQEVRADFPALRDIASVSNVYHEARSPGMSTNISMPQILSPVEISTMSDQYYHYLDGNLLSRLIGYKKFVIGSWQPYDIYLGSDMDYYRVTGYKPYNFEPILRLSYEFWLGTQAVIWFWNDKLAGIIDVFFRRKLHIAMADESMEWAQEIIDHAGTNSFSFLHFPVPHPPTVLYVTPEIGTTRGFIGNDAKEWNYSHQIADRILGRIIDKLENKKLWDKSLIIITGDHSLYNSDLYPDKKKHVPVIIKWPYQKMRKDRTEPFQVKTIQSMVLNYVSSLKN